jgi:hypothetical protein
MGVDVKCACLFAQGVKRRSIVREQVVKVLNNFALDTYPYTFFDLEPGTTQEQVITCLKNWDQGDNNILTLSKAYRLTPGTGWNVPPGILHAPGTLCTYEPQRASDVLSMRQSLIADYLVNEVEKEDYMNIRFDQKRVLIMGGRLPLKSRGRYDPWRDAPHRWRLPGKLILKCAKICNYLKLLTSAVI